MNNRNTSALFLVGIILLTSCCRREVAESSSTNQAIPMVKSVDSDSTFLNQFPSIRLPLQCKTDNFIQNETYLETFKIDSIFVEDYICEVKNNCFYGKSNMQVVYERIGKFNLDDNNIILLYRKVDFPDIRQNYAAVYNKIEKRIISRLEVSGISIGNYTREATISSDMIFTITTTFDQHYSELGNHTHSYVKDISRFTLNSSSRFVRLK